MLIETSNRLQRLERCAQALQMSPEPDESKAELLTHIAGYTTVLKGVEAEQTTIENADVVAAVVTIDEFCELVEKHTQPEA
ncbi:hypothetical protein PsaNZ64_00110 [Pseudomonas syringae pv. actinidiae]|uniref:hypothetical protein n=1 Tax=Pseudomonas syringae group TaxID=136849 RepID=UPI0006B8D2F8|nr:MULTISPECIES: hypothetical protein [Pseudomonas syringae group]KPB17047.1 Unknown protein sequence [Pseudomonas amygdali pv. sesami]OKS78723.1 hypothetical protein PsaNZ64_00110 [Pseudomonas syringae pv. actinidiae]